MPETYTGTYITLFPMEAAWVTAVVPMVADPQKVLTEALNIEYGYAGTIRKRGGVVKVNQSPLINTGS